MGKTKYTFYLTKYSWFGKIYFEQYTFEHCGWKRKVYVWRKPRERLKNKTKYIVATEILSFLLNE